MVYIKKCKQDRPAQLTCLSFRPSNSTSSISVSLGCLLLSALSLISRGSNAILCPFSPASYDVSGARSSFLGAGEATRLASSPFSAVVPAPLRRVSPEADICCYCFSVSEMCVEVIVFVVLVGPVADTRERRGRGIQAEMESGRMREWGGRAKNVQRITIDKCTREGSMDFRLVRMGIVQLNLDVVIFGGTRGSSSGLPKGIIISWHWCRCCAKCLPQLELIGLKRGASNDKT